MHFFEFLDQIDLLANSRDRIRRLEGLKFVPYYGCMLARPPIMRHEKNYYGLMEKILANLGATAEKWSFSTRCCGTFLTDTGKKHCQRQDFRIIPIGRLMGVTF